MDEWFLNGFLGVCLTLHVKILMISDWHCSLHVRNLACYWNCVRLVQVKVQLEIFVIMLMLRDTRNAFDQSISLARTHCAKFFGISERCGRVLEDQDARNLYNAGYEFCSRYVALSKLSMRHKQKTSNNFVVTYDFTSISPFCCPGSRFLMIAHFLLCRRGIDAFRLRPKIHVTSLH